MAKATGKQAKVTGHDAHRSGKFSGLTGVSVPMEFRPRVCSGVQLIGRLMKMSWWLSVAERLESARGHGSRRHLPDPHPASIALLNPDSHQMLIIFARSSARPSKQLLGLSQLSLSFVLAPQPQQHLRGSDARYDSSAHTSRRRLILSTLPFPALPVQNSPATSNREPGKANPLQCSWYSASACSSFSSLQEEPPPVARSCTGYPAERYPLRNSALHFVSCKCSYPSPD